jgi:hypothetical protein
MGRPSLDLDDPSQDSGQIPPQIDSGRLLPPSPDPARVVVPSAQDLPGTATTASTPKARNDAVRYAASILGLIVTTTGAYLTWDRVLRPQIRAPLVTSTVAMPTEAPAGSANGASTPVDAPRWQTEIEEGQQLFAVGDLPAALEKFKHAQEVGAPPAATRAFVEESKAGLAGAGECKMVAFARPRMGVSGSALRPSVASSTKRTLLSWSDDHEQAGHQHIYAVPIDSVGHPLGHPRDLTPEAADVGRASLLAVGDRMALVYSDKAGPELGVRVRWIDEEGRIAGASLQVGGVRGGLYAPHLSRTPDGFFIAWEDERKQDGTDLYLRHLGRELDPAGPELRVTDYRGRPGHRPHIRAPSVAVANNALYLVYQVEREGKIHSVERMRISLDAKELVAGLDFGANAKTDRALGDVQVVSEPQIPSDAPDIACGTEGCFVTWHSERGGSYAALIDPVQGRVMWRKRFTERGTAPSLAASDDGTVAVAYYEAGTVRVARLAREGVSPSSSVARVSGDAPRPSLAPGRAKGEWFAAWQESEGAHTEAYAARIICH